VWITLTRSSLVVRDDKTRERMIPSARISDRVTVKSSIFWRIS
jgi:hypothetical protein